MARSLRRSPSVSLRRLFVWRLILCAGFLSLAAVPMVGYGLPDSFPEIPVDGFTFVERGPMEVVISQVGEIQSADNELLVNDCEFSTRLVSLLPEGTWVEPGDIVAELDTSDLEPLARKREILVIQAEARFRQAKEDLEIQKLTNQSRLAEAQIAVRLAKLELEGYTSASHPQQLHKLQAAVALAEEAVARADDNHQFIKRMVTRGYRQRDDEENARLTLLKSQQSLQTAKDKLTLFEDFAHPRSIEKLTADYEESIRDLERVKNTNQSALLSREVSLRSRERSYRIYKDYLDRLNTSIAACTLRATRPGEVIHGTVSPYSSRKLEEGSSVRHLQTIAKLPNRELMDVHLRIHESKAQTLAVGQTTLLEVDAARDTTLRGRVKSITKVPLSGRYPNYELREYGVVVSVDLESVRSMTLAPGMTATAHILTNQRQSTLLAPMRSIVEVAGRTVAFVRSGDEILARDVEIGLTNENTIEILEGLEEGDEIVLKPRVTCAQRLLDIEARSLVKVDDWGWADWLGNSASETTTDLTAVN
ncbi:MAG: HlyD family efflux transporter periplasmic adaptor subunit [Planctomycetaceae bacterium]|nr:HlyD family efflux transporter periplasmic adaptor subunit [Planctomycetaceae bacterium]